MKYKRRISTTEKESEEYGRKVAKEGIFACVFVGVVLCIYIYARVF